MAQPKPGMTPQLQASYDELYKEKETILEKYRTYVKTLDETKLQNLISRMNSIGFDVNVQNGRMKYSKSFKPMELKYEICYIRHGKTEGNTEPRVFQGQVDYENNKLNDIGKKQAVGAADKMDMEVKNGWIPDLIICSPLSRATETAESFSKRHPEIPNIVEPKSVEMAFGEWDNKQVVDIEKTSTAHLFHIDHNVIVKSDAPHRGPNGDIPSENFCENIVRMHDMLTNLNVGKHTNKDHPKVLMYGHSMAGAAISMLMGHGNTDEGGLSFDGPSTMPNATPYFLKPKNI